ncbi:hypothetical protein BDY21DRAFT_342223 [Lineolata rhizophorae]|uniref:alpha-1,2-Mannosidase n=1 Tax=Lineolata rhizophorae TaxID=578093 RepID=A0A6A6P3F4_9PEZI|nr:hypothetical protein BDY21DRAFT_342223 [Lineolata rhizophorae]
MALVDEYGGDIKADFSPSGFLATWKAAHAAIQRHVYRGPTYQHPHYVQVDLFTGALRAFWIDSLSAYYPGLLALAGEVSEGAAAHLLYAALWTRYGALPERWSTASGDIEAGLRWWGGRPEFVESTWYLHRALGGDPWFARVGEMVLRDVKRRCWTRCGWAGLQDVRSGELNDRMESFFLGETAKYLYLLFDDGHPLNKWEGAWVFTTEGHPLAVPERIRKRERRRYSRQRSSSRGVDSNNLEIYDAEHVLPPLTCPVPPPPLPLSISSTAARPDLFHAAHLARLHPRPPSHLAALASTVDGSPLHAQFTEDHPAISAADLSSPSNYSFFPWTLPTEYVPADGSCAPLELRKTFDLSFPSLGGGQAGAVVKRVDGGILIGCLSGVRLGMIRESPDDGWNGPNGEMEGEDEVEEAYRIYSIGNIALGRDEKVFVEREAVSQFNPADPYFTRVRDSAVVDLVLDVPPPPPPSGNDEDTTAQNADAADTILAALNGSALLSAFTDQTIDLDQLRDLSVVDVVFDFAAAAEANANELELAGLGAGLEGAGAAADARAQGVLAAARDPGLLSSVLLGLQSLLATSTTATAQADTSSSLGSPAAATVAVGKPSSSPTSTAEQAGVLVLLPAALPIGAAPAATDIPYDVPDADVLVLPPPRRGAAAAKGEWGTMAGAQARFPRVEEGAGYVPWETLVWERACVVRDLLCEDGGGAAADGETGRMDSECEVLVVPRGGCSFGEKAANVPVGSKVEVLVVVSGTKEMEEEKWVDDGFVAGSWPPMPRVQPSVEGQRKQGKEDVVLVLVGGGEKTMEVFRRLEGGGGRMGVRRRWRFESQGVGIGNLMVL